MTYDPPDHNLPVITVQIWLSDIEAIAERVNIDPDTAAVRVEAWTERIAEAATEFILEELDGAIHHDSALGTVRPPDGWDRDSYSERELSGYYDDVIGDR